MNTGQLTKFFCNPKNLQVTVLRYCEVVPCDVIVLTGGTGFTQRDCTPEAVQPLFTKQVPGIQTALISESLKKTKFAMLSRYGLTVSMI